MRLKIGFTKQIKQKIPDLKIGILQATVVNIRADSDLVKKESELLSHFIKEKFQNKPAAEDPVVSAVRRMYRRIGWEPTRYRPSSEAMIRRFLRDKPIYRINNLVDLGNIVSARFHIPLGLYDTNKIERYIYVDMGRENETYQGLSRSSIHAQGKLILRDFKGIFGNPTADSRRTRITDQTSDVIAIFFTPPEIDREYLKKILSALHNLYKHECPDSSFSINVIRADESLF